MNDPCPVCGLIFQREEGYFLGAMYVSYILASALLMPFYFLIAALFPGWNGIVVATAAMLVYLPLTPAVFQYSRIVWVYLDRLVDPTGVNAGLYEKIRQVELDRGVRGRPDSQELSATRADTPRGEIDSNPSRLEKTNF